jgi:hypothetical protein
MVGKTATRISDGVRSAQRSLRNQVEVRGAVQLRALLCYPAGTRPSRVEAMKFSDWFYWHMFGYPPPKQPTPQADALRALNEEAQKAANAQHEAHRAELIRQQSQSRTE